ncbi:MAG: hypothetical protein HYU88_11370 [Chloroflexi bacterium]|nr:hypothetical protein [Chloroflexota bacterium]
MPVPVRPPRAPVRLPVRERPARPAPWPEAAPPAPPAVPAVAAPVPPAAELEATPEAPAVPERRAAEAEPPRESVAEVHAAMVDALRQLAAQGKTRVRATNLKDQLLARIPGFSERRYGFSKFKDFLMAAEQAWLITISMLGPVHWVSLPTFAEGAVTPEGERGPLSGRYAEVVRFIAELRQRSRWLTYTYTLNNVVNLLARTLPAEEAEGEARTILNYLVTQGALQIDREPRPVEVGGVTHRVRMCHVNEEHPFFQTLLPAPAGPEEERPAVPAEVGAGEPLAAEGEQPTAPEVAEQPAPSPGEVPESPRRRRPRSRRRRGGREAAGDGAAPSGEGADEEEAPEPVAEAAESVAAAAPTVLSAEAQLAGAPVPAEAAGAAIFELVAADVAQDDGHAVAEATAPPPTVGAAGQPAMEPALEPAMEPAMEAASLEPALAGAAALVREGVSEEQPEVRASTLKQRLVRRLGGFDERRYGFERFRDFLRAAETAGVVRVRDEGRQTWVALPAVEVLEPAAEPPARRRSRRGARGG